MVLVPRQHAEGDENRTGKANARQSQSADLLTLFDLF